MDNIVANKQDISLTTTQDAKGVFCKLWPDVEKGLKLLQGLIKNPIAKAAVGIVIAAGDAVSKQICG